MNKVLSVQALILALITLTCASAASADVLVLDCPKGDGQTRLSYHIDGPNVEFIGDVSKSVLIDRKITETGTLVFSTYWKHSNKILSLTSLTPNEDASIYRAHFFAAETGAYEDFECSRNRDAESELVLQLSQLSKGGEASSNIIMPLSASEKAEVGFKLSSCWNVDPSYQWSRIPVTVTFDLAETGKIQGDIEFVSSPVTDGPLVETAFQTVRRAVMICGAQGFDLPKWKYEVWKTLTVTFDPLTVSVRVE